MNVTSCTCLSAPHVLLEGELTASCCDVTPPSKVTSFYEESVLRIMAHLPLDGDPLEAISPKSHTPLKYYTVRVIQRAPHNQVHRPLKNVVQGSWFVRLWVLQGDSFNMQG